MRLGNRGVGLFELIGIVYVVSLGLGIIAHYVTQPKVKTFGELPVVVENNKSVVFTTAKNNESIVFPLDQHPNMQKHVIPAWNYMQEHVKNRRFDYVGQDLIDVEVTE